MKGLSDHVIRGINPLEELQSSACKTRPSYYQDQVIEEGAVSDEDILGKEIDWDHQRIDEKEINRNQKIRGERIQFNGLKWGIRNSLQESNFSLTN